MNLGDVIKEKRKERSLTQSALAEALGVSTQAVSKWERGVGYPDVTQIVPLAKVLNITTDNLLDYKDRYKEFNHAWQIACCKYEGGEESIYTLIDIDEKALKEYPDDYTFLYRRVVDKYRILAVIAVYGVMIWLIVKTIKKQEMSTLAKVVWCICLYSFNIFVFPIYWFVYLRKE